MNVTVKRNDPDAGKGGQTRVYSLLAAKDFKAGEEIYTVRSLAILLLHIHELAIRNRRLSPSWTPICKDAVLTVRIVYVISLREWPLFRILTG